MTNQNITTMLIHLGKRAAVLDNRKQKNEISEERYMAERNAIDTIVAYAGSEIGYKPYQYQSYTQVITKELSEIRKAETEAKAIKASENRNAKELFFKGFEAGMMYSAVFDEI